MSRRRDSLTLSPQHGVNPSVGVCFYCNEDNGEVILAGRLPRDEEAPRRAVWHKQPCPTCAGYMQQGVILISVRDGEEQTDNPYRTGGWAVVTEDFIRRVLASEVANRLCQRRVAFVPDEAWDHLGLPRGPLAPEGRRDKFGKEDE